MYFPSPLSLPSFLLLQIGRIGPQHQAGSDALMTACLFFKIREQYFPELKNTGDTSEEGSKEMTAAEEKYLNLFYGLSASSNQMLKNSREKERALYGALSGSLLLESDLDEGEGKGKKYEGETASPPG